MLKKSLRLIPILAAALFAAICLFASCSKSGTFLEGTYETESGIGSFVRYEFSKDGEVVCTVYMLGVKTSENTGSYKIEDDKIILYYDDATDTFPFEYNKDSIVINQNTYYKQ